MLIETLKRRGPLEAFSSIRGFTRPFIFGSPASRHTYVGADPFLVAEGGEDGIIIAAGKEKTVLNAKNPFDTLSSLMKEYRREEKGPFPFCGGGVGYISYDMGKDLLLGRGFPPFTGDGLPSFSIGLYSTIFVYDRMEGKGYIVSTGPVNKRIRDALRTGKGFPDAGEFFPPAVDMTSNTSRQGFVNAVERAKEYIAEGDIYQINLSLRMKAAWDKDPFLIYRALSEENPTPFTSFLDLDRFEIVSNTPERFLKVEDGVVLTEPIKGTRPRGKTPEEDASLKEELRNSPKERAEHVMIVDLERNDLGRVSVPGTVGVTGLFSIETFARLHHMVSTVRGRARPGTDSVTCLRETFPGGSVTGAPKIRAVEIIDELEAAPRGVYTGALGWMDFSGDLDFAMAIRTAVFKDGALSLSVGSGIVADSEPGDEYEESMLKARDFLDVLKAHSFSA